MKERLANLEQNLMEARKKAIEAGGKIVIYNRDLNKNVKELLILKDKTNVAEHQSKIFLDLKDIDKCIEFHETLKKRFEKELKIMLDEK